MRRFLVLALMASAAAHADPAFVATAKANVTRDFKDPGSAQWRNLYVSKYSGTVPVLCGEVNAKNAMGGYVGFRRFYATEEALMTTIETNRPGDILRASWDKFCSDRSTPVD